MHGLNPAGSGWLAAGFCLASAILLVPAYRTLRGTTLIAAWAWLVGAALATAVAEAYLAAVSASHGTLAGNPATVDNGTALIRFAAATLWLCPSVALLGAKRPQHRAWQWIVLSLWAILIWPAVQVGLRMRGEAFELHVVQSWFLLALVGIGVGNHLATRFAWPHLALAVGEVLLLWPWLPFARSINSPPGPVWGAGAIFLAALLATRVARRTAPATAPSGRVLARWDRTWRDFRDYYGVVWALRVMERVNAAACSHRSNAQLFWTGFAAPPSPVPAILPDSPDVVPADSSEGHVEQTLRSLLLRFVSPEWIERRVAS